MPLFLEGNGMWLQLTYHMVAPRNNMMAVVRHGGRQCRLKDCLNRWPTIGTVGRQ